MTLSEQDKNKIEEEEKYRAEIRGRLSPTLETRTSRNRVVAALLAIFLGDLGLHKFYLGRTGQGIIYLLFFWTTVPGIIGLIEGIIYLSMSDQAFRSKYG